ncbi:DUF86 domain-containing protein [Acidiphilium sp. AL]|uniref:DUF86 domain-containing protein n=1 Tax=Acidiphilium iwatense TaxID=768198 RepID=A0ABS9E0V2_9PROT|nr:MULTISPECIES: HepT-like ribonuclease domain-containing protein [Acidiphilium]MCF3948564.1 DUF86 domain-containing protein [Acidiphilium iwatense]MCU4162009.1 DUF86 domain-containing protein [Acidiphilium sp. AL]
MERDPRSFLWDVRESADAILRFIAGRSFDDYLADDMLNAAVERHFEIIGEALNRLAKTAPAIAARVPDLANAVAFRNLLIHGYATVDQGIVWRTTQEDLPRLRQAIEDLLAELGNRSAP